MNAKAKQVRFVAANSWKLGWQPDSNVNAVVAASTQTEKRERNHKHLRSEGQGRLP
jgi:hypothetical protein